MDEYVETLMRVMLKSVCVETEPAPVRITCSSRSTVSAGSVYVLVPAVRTCEPCSMVHILMPRLAQSVNKRFKDRRAVFRS